MQSKTKKLVFAALMTALVCIFTLIIKIPSPLKGYLNLGDCMVLLAGWMLPPGYGFLAAGIGSALADLFAGYVVYAPATLLIKGSMALVAFAVFTLFNNKTSKLASRLLGSIAAEIIMVAGYFVFEGLLYGFIPSAVNIPANAVQGVAGIIIGMILINVLEKTNALSEKHF